MESRDNTVEVFGRWQTEEYIPPLVVEVKRLGGGGGGGGGGGLR